MGNVFSFTYINQSNIYMNAQTFRVQLEGFYLFTHCVKYDNVSALEDCRCCLLVSVLSETASFCSSKQWSSFAWF